MHVTRVQTSFRYIARQMRAIEGYSSRRNRRGDTSNLTPLTDGVQRCEQRAEGGSDVPYLPGPPLQQIARTIAWRIAVNNDIAGGRGTADKAVRPESYVPSCRRKADNTDETGGGSKHATAANGISARQRCNVSRNPGRKRIYRRKRILRASA